MAQNFLHSTFFILTVIGTHLSANVNIVTRSINDEAIDPKYFDDINRIINNLNIEKKPLRTVNESGVNFYLFTQTSGMNFSRIDPFNPTLLNIQNKAMGFVIHGWLESRQSMWFQDFTEILLKTQDALIVQVDWKNLADDFYANASSSVKEIGYSVGKLIVKLHTTYGINLKKIGIVGYCLGAHIAAFAGKYVRNATGEQISRIFALDPSGPLFIGENEEHRLSKGDAKHVLVLHTDGGVFGYLDPLGTSDFFVNGGTAVQPGCSGISKLTRDSLTTSVLCSHQMAYKLFVDVIGRPQSFYGVPCDFYESYKSGMCSKNLKVPLLSTFEGTSKLFLRINSESPFNILE